MKEYEVAYGRAGSLEEALQQLNISTDTAITKMGTPASNVDVDEQSVLEAAIEQSETVIAEVPVVVREGPKRVRRNIFIYAGPREAGTAAEMAVN
jgi:hypothetical protein